MKPKNIAPAVKKLKKGAMIKFPKDLASPRGGKSQRKTSPAYTLKIRKKEAS